MTGTPWTADDAHTRLVVRVTPRAKKDRVVGIVEDAGGRAALAIRLAAPPVDGAANKALLAFLASTLRVPKSNIRIIAGETARLKTIQIEGIGLDSLVQRLGAPP